MGCSLGIEPSYYPNHNRVLHQQSLEHEKGGLRIQSLSAGPPTYLWVKAPLHEVATNYPSRGPVASTLPHMEVKQALPPNRDLCDGAGGIAAASRDLGLLPSEYGRNLDSPGKQ